VAVLWRIEKGEKFLDSDRRATAIRIELIEQLLELVRISFELITSKRLLELIAVQISAAVFVSSFEGFLELLDQRGVTIANACVTVGLNHQDRPQFSVRWQ
jgi:hypothetical protein